MNNQKDVRILREMLEVFKGQEHVLKQMRTTGRENKIVCSLRDSLKDVLYHIEDLAMSLDDKHHWDIIMRFQKEKYVL